MRCRIAIKEAGSNYSAYAADLPCSLATEDTGESGKREIRNMIHFQVKGPRQDGLAAPEPTAQRIRHAR